MKQVPLQQITVPPDSSAPPNNKNMIPFICFYLFLFKIDTSISEVVSRCTHSGNNASAVPSCKEWNVTSHFTFNQFSSSHQNKLALMTQCCILMAFLVSYLTVMPKFIGQTQSAGSSKVASLKLKGKNLTIVFQITSVMQMKIRQVSKQELY